jgi:hypothetical protein
MNQDASDWLVVTVLALFCGSMFYGSVVIHALLN